MKLVAVLVLALWGCSSGEAGGDALVCPTHAPYKLGEFGPESCGGLSCDFYGQCTVVSYCAEQGPNGCKLTASTCLPRSDLECQCSTGCRDWGDCHFVNEVSEDQQLKYRIPGECRAIGDDCKHAAIACKQKGWCTPNSFGHCPPASP